jgi:uncharacterized protein (DUF427 family)
MKTPGPDHPIAIAPNPKRVRVILGGTVVAETTRALTLTEASYPPVQYVPREDARLEHFSPSARRTHCPYKGDAAYFTLAAGGETRPDAVWSYEAPFPAVAAIAGHLAFYPDRVDAIEEG